jgi:hypothetical protein
VQLEGNAMDGNRALLVMVVLLALAAAAWVYVALTAWH